MQNRKKLIFGRFKPNGVRNRREVDHSGSNALVHASVDVLGVDFENANRPHSSQHLLALGVSAVRFQKTKQNLKEKTTFKPGAADVTKP